MTSTYASAAIAAGQSTAAHSIDQTHGLMCSPLSRFPFCEIRSTLRLVRLRSDVCMYQARREMFRRSSSEVLSSTLPPAPRFADDRDDNAANLFGESSRRRDAAPIRFRRNPRPL